MNKLEANPALKKPINFNKQVKKDQNFDWKIKKSIKIIVVLRKQDKECAVGDRQVIREREHHSEGVWAKETTCGRVGKIIASFLVISQLQEWTDEEDKGDDEWNTMNN